MKTINNEIVELAMQIVENKIRNNQSEIDMREKDSRIGFKTRVELLKMENRSLKKACESIREHGGSY